MLLYLAAHTLTPIRVRRRLYRRLGISIADSAVVFAGVRVIGGAPLHIGEESFINYECMLDADAEITLGDRVSIGNRVMLITNSHDMNNPSHRAGARRVAPIKIGDGAWIGAGAIILGGVTIGEGVVVGAGSVVTRDCDAHSLYVGTPARLVRRLNEAGHSVD